MDRLMWSLRKVVLSCRQRDMLPKSNTLGRAGSLVRRIPSRQPCRKKAVRTYCTRLRDSGRTVLSSGREASPRKRFVNPFLYIIELLRIGMQVETYNARTANVTPLTIAPLEEQGSLESRRAWSKVQSAIVNGDLETTSAEKTKIENEQRELRKKENDEGREWERRYFTRVTEDPVLVALGDKSGVVLEPEKTGGIWTFDNKKYLKVLEKANAPAATPTAPPAPAPAPAALAAAAAAAAATATATAT